MLTQLAREGQDTEKLMLRDATHLKAHRTAASLRARESGASDKRGA